MNNPFVKCLLAIRQTSIFYNSSTVYSYCWCCNCPFAFHSNILRILAVYSLRGRSHNVPNLKYTHSSWPVHLIFFEAIHKYFLCFLQLALEHMVFSSCFLQLVGYMFCYHYLFEWFFVFLMFYIHYYFITLWGCGGKFGFLICFLVEN